MESITTKKNRKDISYFKRNGLSKREFLGLLWEDIYRQFMVVYLCGIAFSIVIYYIGMKRGMHTAFEWISLKGLEIAIILMVYGILLMILTRLSYYIKINKHVDKRGGKCLFFLLSTEICGKNEFCSLHLIGFVLY